MTSVLLFGKTGQVGFELERSLGRACRLAAPGHHELDLTDVNAIRDAVKNIKPDVIINAAGLTIVDDVETNPGPARQINAVAPEVIAESARETGATLIHFSTTFVFDGTKREPYEENDAPNPLNIYGQTKLDGERAVAGACPHHVILRANWVYSARRRNFALTMLKLAQEKSELRVVTDQIGTPTWARDYAEATTALVGKAALLREFPGIYHLSAQGRCSRLEWAQALIDRAKAAAGRGAWPVLRPTTTAQYPLPAARPLYTATSNRKIAEVFGIRMPPWEDRVDAFVRTLQW